jgi:hypothetical protein
MDFCRRKTLELPMWEPLMIFLRKFWNDLKILTSYMGELCVEDLIWEKLYI